MTEASHDGREPAGQLRLLPERPSPPGTTAWFGIVLAATIVVSAFLLFQVQPLISKCILPWFGGSPAVWTTCMLFFQTVLFGGYLYAHLSEHAFRPRLRLWVHLLLLVLAAAMLQIIPSPTWKPLDSGNPTMRILGLLLVSVGLPYFVLSSTGPLLQAWFSRAYPGRAPYRLYALSNFGSLAALLSYPFLVEPPMESAGARAALVGACSCSLPCCVAAALSWRGGFPPAHCLKLGRWPRTHERPPGWARRLLWIGLPAFASLMLLATTNQVCQNVAVMPFLWVVPLSLYLISFIVCFDHPRWYRRGLWGGLTVALVLLTVADDECVIDVSFRQSLVLDIAAMFGLCMVCHGELVRLRPRPAT